LQRTYRSRDELGARNGAELFMETKNKLKSSTEAELVGVDDLLGYILWVHYFMQEEGFDMEALLLYQDSMSAMLLAKHSKHIKVNYFFIKDKVDQGEVTIEHCPTGQMWTDINTKPKQGIVYCVFRGHVMGISADYKDSDYLGKVPISTAVSMLPLTKEQLALQECVGGDAKQPEQMPIPLTHASGNTCISRCSIHPLAIDRPKKRVQLAVDVAVRAPPDEPQQAPLIMVSGHAWSPGIYWALRMLGQTLDIARKRALVRSLIFKN
jgi:hypothetical protein